MEEIRVFAAGAIAGGMVGFFVAALMAVAGRGSEDERQRDLMHVANRRGYTEGWSDGYAAAHDRDAWKKVER